MTDKVDQYPSIYPSLDNTSQFRLTEISKLKTKLEDEVSDRKRIYKKYTRAVNIIDGTDIGINSIASCLGVTSGVLVATGILIPIGVPMAVSAGVLGVVGIVCKCINRKLKSKSLKHSSIVQTAESKLNSILGIVDKAICDNNISDSEFKLVLDELTKYNHLKKNIQSKKDVDNTGISEDEKNAIILQAKKDFLNQLK